MRRIEQSIMHGSMWNKYLAFTADSQSIVASWWDDTTVKLWDVASGAFVRQIAVEELVPYSSTLATDGKTLAAVCYKMRDDGISLAWSVRGYDLANGKEVFKLSPDLMSISAIAFAPGGKSLVISGRAAVQDNHEICGSAVWDIATGKQLAHLGVDSSSCITFTPAGDILLADGPGTIPTGHFPPADRRGTIRLFNPTTGKELQPRAGHNSIVMGLAFTPDGKELFSQGDSTIRWDLRTGKPTREDAGYFPLAFSPDNRQCACLAGDAKTMIIRDAKTGKELHVFKEDPVCSFEARFSADGKTLISVKHGGAAIIRNLEERKEVRPGVAYYYIQQDRRIGPDEGGSGLRACLKSRFW